MKFKFIKMLHLLFLLTSCNEKKILFSRDYNMIDVKYWEKSDLENGYKKRKDATLDGEVADKAKELFFELINSDFEYDNDGADGFLVNCYRIEFYYDDKRDFLNVWKNYPFPFTNSSIIKDEENSLNFYKKISKTFYLKMNKLIEEIDEILKDVSWIEEKRLV